MYMVIVTYGTQRHQPYASNVASIEDARALRQTAIKLGYTDARIEHEADFRAAQEAARGRAAGARAAA